MASRAQDGKKKKNSSGAGRPSCCHKWDIDLWETSKWVPSILSWGSGGLAGYWMSRTRPGLESLNPVDSDSSWCGGEVEEGLTKTGKSGASSQSEVQVDPTVPGAARLLPTVTFQRLWAAVLKKPRRKTGLFLLFLGEFYQIWAKSCSVSCVANTRTTRSLNTWFAKSYFFYPG